MTTKKKYKHFYFDTEDLRRISQNVINYIKDKNYKEGNNIVINIQQMNLSGQYSSYITNKLLKKLLAKYFNYQIYIEINNGYLLISHYFQATYLRNISLYNKQEKNWNNNESINKLQNHITQNYIFNCTDIEKIFRILRIKLLCENHKYGEEIIIPVGIINLSKKYKGIEACRKITKIMNDHFCYFYLYIVINEVELKIYPLEKYIF